ncbi:unnamed protein product [Caenorhabditis auriculariae]|uniref:Uncharacterized protein n=1 Tax=Caenorhabditis auriculariae TaxID=2777116 RepID=A0A8S1HLR7_9PELO|nr:unnamed protein product [Caenorhabditis auriculariae]
MSAHEVSQCLQRSSAKYVDSSKKDIMGALSEFKDLSPGTDTFMFPDGKRRTAFRLKGTIPVIYKGNKYNIPITVYLWETHPYYAPICFVNPTSTMVIKESENVNKEGRVFLPYLNEWRFPGYDLNGLLQVMAMVFQDKCPVFARSNSTTSNSSTPQPRPMPTPNPSYPSAQPANPTTPYPSSTPYPNAGTSGYNPYMNVNNTPYPMGMPSNMPTPGYPSAGGRVAPPIPPPPSSSSTSNDNSTIHASVLSALEDSIRFRLREKLGTKQAEIASINTVGNDLRTGQQALKRHLDELEGQRTTLTKVVKTYTEKREELSKALAACSKDETVSVDDAIDAATPLHRQLLSNYVQDLCCDDTIYTLGQFLKQGNLTLAEYLKRIRDVSREQFIYRATMQKCRRVAGLPV